MTKEFEFIKPEQIKPEDKKEEEPIKQEGWPDKEEVAEIEKEEVIDEGKFFLSMQGEEQKMVSAVVEGKKVSHKARNVILMLATAGVLLGSTAKESFADSHSNNRYWEKVMIGTGIRVIEHEQRRAEAAAWAGRERARAEREYHVVCDRIERQYRYDLDTLISRYEKGKLDIGRGRATEETKQHLYEDLEIWRVDSERRLRREREMSIERASDEYNRRLWQIEDGYRRRAGEGHRY